MFLVLTYVFSDLDRKETERKIKRRLKYHKLGEYNQSVVDYIRQLKDDLHVEIYLGEKSKYFCKSKLNYAAFDDFEIEQMVSDYIEKYNNVGKDEIIDMINFAIYLYHLRQNLRSIWLSD